MRQRKHRQEEIKYTYRGRGKDKKGRLSKGMLEMGGKGRGGREKGKNRFSNISTTISFNSFS